jgi:cell division protein FtsB
MAKILRFRKAAGAENVTPPAVTPPVFRPPKPPATKTDARPSTNFASDARPADGMPRPGKPDPDAERRRRWRRSAALVLLGLVIAGASAATIFGDRGYLAVRRSHEDLAKLAGKVEEAQERVRGLKADVDRLRNDPSAIERIAREQLGYAQPGEITFLIGDGETDKAPVRRAAPSSPKD